MKKLLIALSLVALSIPVAIGVSGCTENQRAKKYGGSGNQKLPCDRKLVDPTWKSDNLWLLTRPMRPEESPETYEFGESSSWGLLEGNITIVESRCNGRERRR